MKVYLETAIKEADDQLARMKESINELSAKLDTVMHQATIISAKRDAWQEALNELNKPQ